MAAVCTDLGKRSSKSMREASRRDRGAPRRPAAPRVEAAVRRRLRGTGRRVRDRRRARRRRAGRDPDRRFLRAADEAGRAARSPSDPHRPPHTGGAADRARGRGRRGALDTALAEAADRRRDLRGPRVVPHPALAPAPDGRGAAVPRGPRPRAGTHARAPVHARPRPAAADRGARADRAHAAGRRRRTDPGARRAVHDPRSGQGHGRPAAARAEGRGLPASARCARVGRKTKPGAALRSGPRSLSSIRN